MLLLFSPLSAIFIRLCTVVYSVKCFGRRGEVSAKQRQVVEGGVGGLILVAAGLMAAR